MSTNKQERRLSRARRTPPSASSEVCQLLTAEQLQEAWAAYMADRDDWRLRNQLVEHYLPHVRRLAGTTAKKMRLRDKQNAVGEVLTALVESIVPGYDGRIGFDRWARICITRKLIDQRRVEQKDDAMFAETPPEEGETSVFELVPDREPCNGDLRFVELTAELSDRQAMVLWLRFCRGMTVEAVAGLLDVSPTSVKFWTRDAVSTLQNQLANCPMEDVSAYL